MRNRLLSISLAVLLPALAAAQDPVRLPTVKVTDTMMVAAPRRLTGIVNDTSGRAIPEAEVTIPSLRRRIYTTAEGTFRFDDLAPGTYTMRARKIGYGSELLEVDIGPEGGGMHFELTPIAHALPTMVTSSARGGLSGIVGDTAYAPLANAHVKVFGAGLEANTDSTGQYFLPVHPGQYMIEVTKDSFATRLASVSIPRDSGRHLMTWLEPGRPVPVDESRNVDQLRERQAYVRKAQSMFFTHEDLVGMKIEWIYDVTKLATGKFGYREPPSSDCHVVVNGGPATINVANLTIDEVESVEIYPNYPMVAGVSGASAKAGNRKAQRFTDWDNTRWAQDRNGTRKCAGVFVWLR
jgi:hypothetical protein